MGTIGIIGLALLGAVGGFILFLHVLDKQPIKRGIGLDQVRYYVNILYKSGYDGGILFLDQQKSKHFLQIQKHLPKRGQCNLTIDFPKAEWSEPYFSKLKEYTVSHNWEYETIEATSESPLEFLIINCGDDVAGCVSRIESTFVDVLGYNRDEIKLNVRFANVSPYDERIGV